MSTSAMIGPGLLMGSFALFILTGFALSILEKRLESKREH